MQENLKALIIFYDSKNEEYWKLFNFLKERMGSDEGINLIKEGPEGASIRHPNETLPILGVDHSDPSQNYFGYFEIKHAEIFDQDGNPILDKRITITKKD